MTAPGSTQPIGLGAAAIQRRIAARELSAEEVMRLHLERIATLEPTIDAFLALDAERALDQARRLDAALAKGAPAPPLAGVPLAVKDILHATGFATSCGSRLLAGYRPPFAATVVARLEAAGAIVVGKTNMDEFAMGSSTEHSAYKPTRNPWDRERVPGGSSGGSAAAVASRMVPLALGTDTGGSIRQPAALCGVAGLKPTWGRASRYGVVAFASSLDQVGPLARQVEDLAVAASVLCGHDPHDATSATEPVPDLAAALPRGVRGLRLGVPRRFVSQGVEPATLARFEEALRALTTAGASVADVELEHLPHAIPTYYLVATAEASSNLARYDGVRYGVRAPGVRDLPGLYGETRDLGFGEEVKRRILLGTFALSSGYYDAYYLRAQKVRTLIRRDFQQAFASLRRDRHADDAGARLPLRREDRRPAADVPGRHLHRAREPRRPARAVAAVRPRLRPAGRLPGRGPPVRGGDAATAGCGVPGGDLAPRARSAALAAAKVRRPGPAQRSPQVLPPRSHLDALAADGNVKAVEARTRHAPRLVPQDVTFVCRLEYLPKSRLQLLARIHRPVRSPRGFGDATQQVQVPRFAENGCEPRAARRSSDPEPPALRPNDVEERGRLARGPQHVFVLQPTPGVLPVREQHDQGKTRPPASLQRQEERIDHR